MTETRVGLGGNLEVGRASQEDLDSVWGIIKSDSDWLAEKGLDHWRKYYTREKVQRKIYGQEVYLAYQNNNLAGTVTLDTNPVEYYRPEEMNQFTEPDASGLYVTALAVVPAKQGQGIASKLMEFADSEAKKKGVKYIRFDCRAAYKELVDFYKKRGYKVIGETLDEEDNNERYLLMEKEIK